MLNAPNTHNEHNDYNTCIYTRGVKFQSARETKRDGCFTKADLTGGRGPNPPCQTWLLLIPRLYTRYSNFPTTTVKNEIN